VLWAWDYLHGKGCAQKLLVVAPLSTLNFTWGRECFATLPHRKVAVLHGTKAKRLERLANKDVDIYIINHDGLNIILEALGSRPDIDTLVIDEIAVYRNDNPRSKVMRRFAQRFTWGWGMTGAPMPNEPTDVWGQAQILTPQTVPRRRGHCRDMLMKQVSTFKYVPRPDAVNNAFNMLQPAVRYSLDDVVELPELVSRTIEVPLSPDQDKVYKTLAAEFAAMVKGKQITAMNAGAAMNKLLQVSCGWVYCGMPEFVKLDCQPRTDLLVDTINAATRKLLVFVPYRHAINGISGILDKAGIEHAVVHGGVSNRDQIFNLFQNTDKYKVLLAHPECLAHGITLTAADTIIWYSPLASLEIYEQANARIRRIGQKHRQLILHFQATPVERKIYALLRNKQKIQDQLLAMFEEQTATL
jgi:SNF2 family DNA or RNA helicase